MKKELRVFTKHLDEMEWNLTLVSPATSHQRRGSMSSTRPVSAYGLAEGADRMSKLFGGGGSVQVGNGFGGLLQVPIRVPGADGGRPRSSGGLGLGRSLGKSPVLGGGGEWPAPVSPWTGNKRESKYDMWR
jgi:hypothetical protein